MVLNCIIIGSDPAGFEDLENYLSRIPYVYLAGRFNTIEEATFWLQTRTIHVLLVGHYPDQSPKEQVQWNVLPIMLMTYEAPPSRSYDVLPAALLHAPLTQTDLDNIFDYIYNIIDMSATTPPTQLPASYFMLKTQYRHEKVVYDDLQYVEVLDDHITLHMVDQKLVTTETLDWIIAQLPANAFMRVHRWFVVGFRHITHLDQDHVMIGDARIALTTEMRNELAKRYKLPY